MCGGTGLRMRGIGLRVRETGLSLRGIRLRLHRKLKEASQTLQGRTAVFRPVGVPLGLAT